jgi:hypothetical protein
MKLPSCVFALCAVLIVSGCGGGLDEAADRLERSTNGIDIPEDAGRAAVFGIVTDGNAFDDYELAAQQADGNGGQLTARVVAALIERGASRKLAADPHRLDIGPASLQRFRAAKVAASAADRALANGDLVASGRLQLALLRYGQDISFGSVMNLGIGIAVQQRAANGLSELLNDHRTPADLRRRINYGTLAVLHSQLSPARRVRQAVLLGAAQEIHGVRSGAFRADSRTGDRHAKGLAETRRLVEQLSAASDTVLRQPNASHVMCMAARASERRCRHLRDRVAAAVELDNELRTLARDSARF